MARRRFRWLPRFSIGNLLMLMVVIGLCLAWYDQQRKLSEHAGTIDSQRRAIRRLTVNGILRQHATDRVKAAELEPLVRLGEPIEAIEAWCGPRIAAELMDGPGGSTFGFADCDLVVECDSQGVVRSLGYQRWKAASCEIFPVYVPVAPDKGKASAQPQGILSQRGEPGGMR